MGIYVLRNNQRFGPYSEQALLAYVNAGQILTHDRAIRDGETTERTVGYYLKQAGLKTNIQHNGSIWSQIKAIGAELLFPNKTMFTKQFVTDPRFMILALVGLFPLLFVFLLPVSGYALFYVVSLYFAAIWGLFFYFCFKPQQVSLKTTLMVFFLTQICIFTVWWVLGLTSLNPFYALIDVAFPINMLGYVFGVGLTEELVKMIPLILIIYFAKEPLLPQTMVFYGLMSGIAFGVFEGVDYQVQVNYTLEYDKSFFMNIARLTSLPFLHACWCGLAGYFLAFAQLYPKYRRGLYVLALAIPMTIHGLYDTFAGIFGPVSLFLVVISLMLLVVYLKQGVNYQSKLRQ